MDEFVFRFNQRNANHRGLVFHRLLEACVHTKPHTLTTIMRPPSEKMLAAKRRREEEWNSLVGASEDYADFLDEWYAGTTSRPDDPF